MPLALEDYNHHRYGVDICNSQTARYKYQHRTKKWWKILFFYLMRLAISNSYVYYSDVTRQRISFLEFYEQIISGFIPAESYDDMNASDQGHYPNYINEKSMK